MRILIDMNLPQRWVGFFADHGLKAIHWSAIGQLNAPDSEVLEWARKHSHVVFTHDLDFSVILESNSRGWTKHRTGPYSRCDTRGDRLAYAVCSTGPRRSAKSGGDCDNPTSCLPCTRVANPETRLNCVSEKQVGFPPRYAALCDIYWGGFYNWGSVAFHNYNFGRLF